MRRILLTAGLILVFCLTMKIQQGLALQFTVNDNITGTTYVPQNGAITGSFNLGSALPNNGSYTAPYNINSATASFTFEDNIDQLINSQSTSGYQYNYSYWNGSNYTSVYYRYIYNYMYDPYEQPTVTISGQMSTNGTTYYSMGTQYAGSNNYWYDSSYFYYIYDYYYNVQNGYRGRVTLNQNLNALGLNDLSSDGKIGFTISSLYGDINYLNGSLTADVDTNPVPEPGTMVLLGFGMLGLAVYGKRRQNKHA